MDNRRSPEAAAALKAFWSGKDITGLLQEALTFERARSRKTKLVAKLAAGRIEARLLPDQIKKEIKKRRIIQSNNK